MATTDDDRPHPVRRMAAIAVVAFVALLIGLVAVAIVFRKPVAEALLLDELARRSGAANGTDEDRDVAVSVTRFDREHLELRGLRIGDSLLISRLDARYSPTGLIASQLESVSVSGLRLRGQLDESGISFGRLDAMLGSQTDTSPNEVESGGGFSLPTSHIEIDDARIELETPDGPLVVTLGSRISHPGPGRLQASAELSVDHRLANLVAQLSADGGEDAWTGQISLEAALSGEFGSSLRIGELTLSAHPVIDFADGQLAIRTDECVALRVEQLAIADGARLIGPFQFCARSESAVFETNGAGTLNVDVSIEPFSVDLGGEPGARLSVASKIPMLKIQGQRTAEGESSASLSADSGHLVLPFDIGARGIQLEASETPSSTRRGTLRVEGLFDTQKPARFSEMGLRATLAEGGAALDPSMENSVDVIDFDLEIADADRNIVVAVAGKYEPTQGAGSASVQMRPFEFCPDAPKLTAVVPLLQGIVSEAQGSIAANGTLEWDAESTRAVLQVALRDISATVPPFEIEHLNAAVSLTERGTPPEQLLSIGRIDFGLELTGGEILFQILPGGQVAIESAVWGFAGGELSTAGQIDPVAQKQSIEFDVRDVDLATLFELVALDGLSGTGTLEGNLPLERDGDRIEIRDAKLHSGPKGGTIQYRPNGGTANIGAADQQFGALLTILEDFYYTGLSLTISGDAAGEVTVAIRLEGKNPNFEAGRAVDFNLSIEAHLSDLISSENAAYQIPYLIEERFRDFAGPEVNSPSRPCVHDQ